MTNFGDFEITTNFGRTIIVNNFSYEPSTKKFTGSMEFDGRSLSDFLERIVANIRPADSPKKKRSRKK